MKHSYTLCLVCLLLLNCKNEQKTQNSFTENNTTATQLSKQIDKVINDYMALDIFSGIVLVAKEGNITYHKAFGLADRANNRPNTINTLFDIGSMNKTFTSIVIKQLIAEGKLKYEDKLVSFVPGFKDERAKNITIEHLLNHESGFEDYHTPEYFELPKEERKLWAIVKRAKSYPLHFSPGDEQAYSNLGYVLLGAVIETVTKKSYFDNVHERIVKPLNLKNTYLNNFNGLENRLAKGYYYTPLGQLEVNETMLDEPNPDGGFLSTTEDVMTFYRSYYYDDLLLSNNTKANDPFFNYINNLPEGKATGAAGGFEGFNTALYQVISDDLTIIVFANMDEPVAENIALDILSLTRNEIPEKPQLPAIQNVRKAFEEHGVQYVKENFEALTKNYHPTDPKDFILNDLGYAYLYGANDIKKAEQLFKLNTQLFPEIANCWDSYGEALAKQGKTQEAIDAYKKALSIRPNLESAQKALKALK